MAEQNHINELRRGVLERVARAYMNTAEDFPAQVAKIPFAMRPKNYVSDRCCVYKDRAVLRYRIMAALGFLPEDENGDDSIPLARFASEAATREDAQNAFILSSCDIACHGCVDARYFVTDVCQGCTAHQCVGSCRFGAISIVNGRSQIDVTKCRNCGLCQEACPYGAITRLSVPCERSCPVGAINKTECGRAEIDFAKCTSCGRCMRACPFGAVLERSEIVSVLRALQGEGHVTALVAPAIAGQFAEPLPKVLGALKKLGFSAVLEVAEGADITSCKEAAEFIERMHKGDRFMTTSCCPGYIQAVKRCLPEIAPFVSETRTPMHYTAELAKERFPGTTTVFVGPCVAKRVEGRHDPMVDCVLTFEELGALFAAADIVPAECPEEPLAAGISGEARRYAITGGVAAAVQKTIGDAVPVTAIQASGLSLKGLKELRGYAVNSCPGNLVEVMACEGGCVGGSGVLGQKGKAAKAVERFAEESRLLEK